MTKEQMVTLLVQHDILSKLTNTMKRKFPSDARYAEDWAQEAIVRATKIPEKFYDANGIMGYAHEAAVGLALNSRETAITRREILKDIQYTTPKYYDDWKHIDYKVDLENAIKAVVLDPLLRTALWHVKYEKFTWSEVIENLPPIRKLAGWRASLVSANAALRKEMTRKGYGRQRNRKDTSANV